MRPVNIHAAKTHLSRLVEKVAGGEEVVIAKAGKAMVKLVPLNSPGGRKRRLGILAGRAQMPKGFSAPLPLGTLDGPEDV